MDKTTPENKKLVTGETVTSMIRILSYQDGQMSGHFYNSHFNQGAFFASELELIQIMHGWMNALSFPQSTVQYRSLRKKTGRAKLESDWENPALMQEIASADELPQQEILATFVVRIKFRQYATWQGTVRWIEQERNTDFRSALELFLIMDRSLKE